MPDTSIPSLRPSQQDGAARGILKNSVNLFRGTVNQSQTFFTMPGRNKEDGLSVSISALYQGGRQNHADFNNADAPVGVLGLGWKLNLSYVSMDPACTWPEHLRRYTLHMEGNDFALIREPLGKELFSSPFSQWGGKISEGTAPKAVVDLFHRHGVMLSGAAVIEKDGAEGRGSFKVYDDELQQAYIVEEINGLLYVYVDGESYQTAPYEFWQITYIPRYERWSMIKEDGTASSFGGGVKRVPGTDYQTSEGNSIVWKVCWTDEAGVPVWSGDSSCIENQKQYASAWYQNRLYSRFGEYVSVSYNEFGRDEKGLIRGVEQLTAKGGYPYTKACYLTGITDVLGRKASLIYKEKSWSNASDCDAREYGASYSAQLDGTPNGYQECYESKYLHEIAVEEPDNTPLLGVQFDYGEGPVVLSGETGDYAKRLLRGYHIVSSTGEYLAGSQFEYITGAEDKKLAGFLKKMIWPTGGEAEYSYEKLSLDICQRSCTLTPPSDMPSDSHPTVFSAGNSTTIIWHHRGSGKLALQIATWYGQWQLWQPLDSCSLLHAGDGIDLESLKVLPGSDYIAVSYDTDEKTFLHLYRNDKKNPSGWIAAVSDLKPVKPGLPAPFSVWERKNGKVDVRAGGDFLLVWQMRASDYTRTFDIFTWNWISGQWEKKTETRENHVILAAASSSYVETDADGNVSYHFLDQMRQWHASQTKLPLKLGGISQIALAANDQFAALTRLLSTPNETVQRYELYLLRWNSKGEFLPFTKYSLQHKNPRNSWSPVIVSDSMVAVAGHLARFDGKKWSLNSSLCPKNSSKTEVIHYAYGPDYGIAVRTNSGPVKASFISFQPDGGTGWLSEPIPIRGLSTPGLHSDTANRPVAGGEHLFLIGSRLFHRLQGQSWKEALLSQSGESLEEQMRLTDPNHRYQVNSSAVSIQAPNFLVCALYNLDHAYGKNDDIAVVFRLKNNRLYGAPKILKNRKIWSSNEWKLLHRVNYPFGNLSFVSYPDTCGKMYEGSEIRLHRFAVDSIDGPVVDYPVRSITINDGLGGISKTTYCQDGSTASVSEDGAYVKYYKTVYYPDGTPEHCPCGSVETQFLNTNHPDMKDRRDYCWMMDGLTGCVKNRNAEGTIVSSEQTIWQIYTTAASEPASHTAKPVYSAYIRPSQILSSKDGLTSRVTYSFTSDGREHIFHGQPVYVETETQTLTGVEKQTKHLRYVGETYAAARQRHILTPLSQAMTAVNGIPTVIQAVTYRLWPSCYPDGVETLDQEGEYYWKRGAWDFPFGNPEKPSEIPSNWMCKAMVRERTREGQCLLVAHPCEATEATRYSAKYALPVTKVDGALNRECAWNSFFSYDEPDEWSMSGNTSWKPEAWFGDRSLLLEQGASIQTKVQPCFGRTKYVVGIRYRSESSDQDTAALIKCWEGDREHMVLLTGTGGKWRFVTRPIPLWTDCASMRLSLSNPHEDRVIVDTLFALPAEANIQAQFWRAGDHRLAAAMDIAGRVQRIIYDHFTRPIGEAFPDGSLKELSLFHSFTQDGLRYGENRTNTELRLMAAGENRIENFDDGDSWRRRWTPGRDANWRTEKGVLLKSGEESDHISWKNTGETAKRAVVYAEMVFAHEENICPSLSFGDGYQITWRKLTGWELTDKKQQILQKPLWNYGNPSGHWLLTVSRGLLLFYFNGRIVFSLRGDWGIASTISLHTGNGQVQFYNLFAGLDPMIYVTHRDGLDQERQIHCLWGDDTLISEQIYDGKGSVVAATRPVPGSFGQGNQEPPFVWHDNLVDRTGFLQNLDTQTVLSGDAADYYRGQDGRVDDEGYPYWGWQYEQSPLRRVLEAGGPGSGNCIRFNQENDGPPSHFTQYQYHDGDDGLPVPGGQFHVSTTVHADGVSMNLYKDTIGRDTAQIIKSPDGTDINCTTVEYSYGSEGGETYSATTQFPPNSFSGSERQDTYARTVYNNALNQITSWTDCDTGTTEFITDGLGHKRFIKTPVSDETGQYLYYVYDRLGRVKEEGVIYGIWKRETLKRLAEMPGRPDTGGRQEVLRYYQYGEGENPFGTGMPVSVTTFNPAPRTGKDQSLITVTESMEYDENGRIAALSLRTDGLRDGLDFHGTITYKYNGLGQIKQINYPDGGPIKSVFYTYNDQGRIETIYSPVLAHPIASYTWTEDGKISLLVRGGVEERWTYTSSGRIKSHTARRVDDKTAEMIYNQKLWYNPQGMAERRMTKTEFFEKDELFEYDYLWRLTGAKTIGDNLGALEQVLYDANGNILQAARSGNELKAVLEEGTNRLASVLLGDKTMEFSYGDNGNPVNWRGIRCGYDACGTQLNELDTGQDVIRFVRGSRDEPLIWMTDHSVNMRYRRNDGVPLFTWDGQNTSIWIPGQDSTAATLGKDGVRYPISDPSGTVWAVADQCGHLTAAFDYEPFGSVVGRYGAEERQWPFLFHGKEWISEASLYVFGSRLYDPELMRFLTQDPARQFATPYVFLGNNPLVLVDPSGNMTMLGKIFSAMGFFLIAALGIAASVGIMIASAGAATPAAALAIGFFGGMATGALTGVGMSGGIYCATTPADKFSNEELGKAVWQGAVSGAISGAISGYFGAALNLGIQGAASSTIIISHIITDSLVNGASNVITTGTMAAINGTELSGTDLLITAGIGCAVGVVTGFLSGVKGCTLNDAVTSGANKVTQKMIDVSCKIDSFLKGIGDEVKALSCSQKIILAVSAVAVVDIACIVVDTPLECMDFPESSYAKKVRASYLHLAPA